MKGYPGIPAIFIVIYCLVNASVMIANPQAFIVGFLLFLSGWPLYLGLKRMIARTVLQPR